MGGDARGIDYRLAEVERLALKTGLAIAIGHPPGKDVAGPGGMARQPRRQGLSAGSSFDGG